MTKAIGTSMTDYGINDSLRAQITERRLYGGRRKPKPMSMDYVGKLKHIADGDQFEVRYVLIDYSDNRQLKVKFMTRLEAFRRNASIRGLGMAWAMCSSGRVSA